MLGTVLMASSLPTAFSGHGLLFAGAYVAIHVGRGLFLATALTARQVRLHAGRFIFWFVVSVVPWLTGGLVANTARGLLWAAALAVDYDTPARSGALIPIRGGGRPLGRALPAVLHPRARRSPPRHNPHVHRAGSLVKAAIEASRDPGRFVRSAPYTHLLMVAGVVAAAAGFEIVIAHPTEHTTPWLAGLILGGPALFLADNRTRATPSAVQHPRAELHGEPRVQGSGDRSALS